MISSAFRKRAIFPVFQVITIVELGRNLPRLPLRVFLGELPKLRAGHEIFVDEETLESYFVFGDRLLEQLTNRYRKYLLKSCDLILINADCDDSAGKTDHRRTRAIRGSVARMVISLGAHNRQPTNQHEHDYPSLSQHLIAESRVPHGLLDGHQGTLVAKRVVLT